MKTANDIKKIDWWQPAIPVTLVKLCN